MNDPFLAVREALDALDTPLTLFIRDDDAGWDDARLLRLLDTTAAAGVPIDLAAIPMAMNDSLAGELRERIDAAPHLVGVHQHGHSHTNHEPQGRGCEFGPARDGHAQHADLLQGRLRLQRHFGERLLPIFTPPWNRCAPYTAPLLAQLGFRALSRDRGAVPQAALPELPVDVDWSKHHRAGGLAAVATAFADTLRARGADGRALGLMLHHAVMTEDELDGLAQLLQATLAHPCARWVGMATFIEAEPRTVAGHQTAVAS